MIENVHPRGKDPVETDKAKCRKEGRTTDMMSQNSLAGMGSKVQWQDWS